ncbi:MAG: transcription termination factor NusA [bacterium]
MKTDFLMSLKQIEREREISMEEIRTIVEDAIARAFQAESQGLQSIRVEFEPEEGIIGVFRVREVVRDVENPSLEVSLEDAASINPDIEIGELVEEEVPLSSFRRIGIQAVKQYVTQRIRELERNIHLERFSGRVGEIVTGTVARVNNQGVMVNLGKIDAFMPTSETIPHEKYLLGKRLRVFISEIKQGAKDSEIIVSRASTDFVRGLFALEVPEVAQHIVQIKNLVREAGYRTKMAVISTQEKVDPVGACVGHRGQRVKNVVNELSGEKIDIIPYSDNPAQYIASALSPAQVISVEIFEEDHSAEIIVPDTQLSLAIGKAGQNARLANKLTTWKIDILSEEEKERLERELRTAKLLEEHVSALGLPTRIANLLDENEVKTVNDLVQKTHTELEALPGVGAKSMEDITTRLKELGLALRPEETEPAADTLDAAAAPESAEEGKQD